MGTESFRLEVRGKSPVPRDREEGYREASVLEGQIGYTYSSRMEA